MIESLQRAATVSCRLQGSCCATPTYGSKVNLNGRQPSALIVEPSVRVGEFGCFFGGPLTGHRQLTCYSIFFLVEDVGDTAAWKARAFSSKTE